MRNRGELYHNPAAREGVETLDADFWDQARALHANIPPHSVHLKLDPEVFEFFKKQGKGHLTRMQNVLKAYALSQRSK